MSQRTDRLHVRGGNWGLNLLTLLLLCMLVTLNEGKRKNKKAEITTTTEVVGTGNETSVEELKEILAKVARQVMMQQLAAEEKARSEGTSGLKQTRSVWEGLKPYHYYSYTGRSVAAMHEHSNNDRTMGLGEVVVVINGVEFRTRHNDYRLYMPSTKSSDYHATEDVPFPKVPSRVTKKETIDEQVAEMKEWFKAFMEQDYSVRDYRKFFKPILCYMEAAWTLSEGDIIEESFESDRHHIDATSWFDLQEKVRFMAYGGRKSEEENYAYLPTSIIDIKNGTPIFAQWNYRILCHPLTNDLPLRQLVPVDDLGLRLSWKRTYEEHINSRAARFKVSPLDPETDDVDDSKYIYGHLDDLMNEIPGMNNYGADLRDDLFHEPNLQVHSDDPLNTGYYSRWYRADKKGAMGLDVRSRGFADMGLYCAMTTQPAVAPMTLRACKGGGRHQTCEDFTQRWTYAIPWEIIYMTPLSSWNPYDLEHKGDHTSDPEAKWVTEDGRNGGLTKDKAYNGTSSKYYHRIPEEFFTGGVGNLETDPADTHKKTQGVLDKNGDVRSVWPAGHRFFHEIPGVGTMRQRYPVMPISMEGSQVFKELAALKDVVLNPNHFINMLREHPDIQAALRETISKRSGDSEQRSTRQANKPLGGLRDGNEQAAILETSNDPKQRLVRQVNKPLGGLRDANKQAAVLETSNDPKQRSVRQVDKPLGGLRDADKQAAVLEGSKDRKHRSARQVDKPLGGLKHLVPDVNGATDPDDIRDARELDEWLKKFTARR